MRKTIFVFVFVITFISSVHADVLLKNDGTGEVVMGGRQNLIDAVLEGYDVTVQISQLNQIYRGKQTSVVEIDGIKHICLMTRTYAPNMSGMGTYSAKSVPYWVQYCSNGRNYVRHFEWGNEPDEYKTNQYTMTWRKRSDAVIPTVLLTNNGSGNIINGEKQDLVDAISNGKTVVVKFGTSGSEKIYRGSFPQIHGSEVCLMHFVWAYNISARTPQDYDIVDKPWSKNMCTNGTEYVKHPDITSPDNNFQMTWIQVD